MTLRRLKLGHKLSLSFAVLIILMIFATLVIAVMSIKKDLMEQERINNINMAKNLAGNLKEYIFELDFMAIDSLAKGLSEIGGVSSVVIADKTGKVIGSTDKALLGNEDRGLKKFVEESAALSRDYVFEDMDELRKRINVPVFIGDEVWGVASVIFDYKEVGEKIHDRIMATGRKLILLAFIVLAIGLGGSWFIAFLITKPIKELRSKMTEVYRGNIDVPVESMPVVKCWEFMNCDKTDCSVYGKDGERCWLSVGTKCEDVQGKYTNKLGDCTVCPVYRLNCGDEVGELREAFYEMLRKIRLGINELQRANEEKQELHYMATIGEMSARIAHEIRNALYSIGGAVSYMRRNVDFPVVKEFTAVITDEVKRLKELSDSFLNFAKPVKLRYSAAAISDVIDETVRLIEQELKDGGIEVARSYETAGETSFDKNQLKQVLLNLFINSMDAMPEGGKMDMKICQDRKFFVISVSDTGYGIDSDSLPKIFDPFFTTKPNGSGLGLAVVNKIIRAHGGHINVRSEKGHGTEFSIYMPSVADAAMLEKEMAGV